MIRGKAKGARSSQVEAICDTCGHTELLTCDYEQFSPQKATPDVGQAHKKLVGKGWEVVKGHLNCPACKAERKSKHRKEAEPMAQVTEIRKPTREQKREIIALLTEVYDTKAERYRGVESDVTVAEAIGGGCMFGWVAEIRDEMFGPDGRNEEHELLLADIRKWQAEADARIEQAEALLKEARVYKEQVEALAARLGHLVRIAGPKAQATVK